jgi:hypothetical protein
VAALANQAGGSNICVGIGQNDLRFGDVDCGTMTSSTDEFLCSCWRSVEAKLRAEGLRGGVVSPLGEGRMMVLVQRSHTPELYVMGC